MKNLSLYSILSILLSAKANALPVKSAFDLAFSGFQPEISLGEQTMVSGFSAVTGAGLDVTYNDKSELNKNDIKKPILPSNITNVSIDKNPPFHEATVKEPLVINDWSISVGYDANNTKEIAKFNQQNTKTQETSVKPENTPPKTSTKTNEKQADDDDYIDSVTFDKNDIKSTKKSVEEDGMGVMEISHSIHKKEQQTTKNSNKKQISDIENETTDIVLKIKEDEPKQSSKSSDTDKSSPWVIATVRGQTNNRLAAIGNDKDISKYMTNKGIVSQHNQQSVMQNDSIINPWAIKNTEKEKNKSFEEPHDFNLSKKRDYDYRPDNKINQWSMKEMIYRPSVSAFSDSEFTSTKMNTNYDFDDRWINEPKAVLINSISSKPLLDKSKQSNTTDLSLKSDEKEKTPVSQPKKLLTKIEDNDAEQSPITVYSTNNLDSSNNDNSKENILPNSHISLNEIRLNFKPGYADLSMPSIRLLSAFASRVAINQKAIIELRISDKSSYLQSKRLTIIKQILQTNGIDKNRMIVVKSDRDTDTMVIRNLSSTTEQPIKNEIKIKEKIKKW